MKIEHVAFNVPDPVAAARWYVENLGFTVKRRFVEPPYGHFLADDSGTVMVELYKRTDAPVPDYPAQHPAVLHLALTSRDVEADVRRLTAAGGALVGEIDRQAGGDVLAFVRDPWGVSLQLVQRSQPMV
jgi:catechol 2,3-dioxygenase-like lactoylglutathione lyase family enzyme